MTDQSLITAMADAISLADRLIERGYGTDVPKEWGLAVRKIYKARVALARGMASRVEAAQTTWLAHRRMK